MRNIFPASSPAHATKSKKLGFVAAKPIPQVRRNINAFALGAQSVDPKIELHVIFTGDWSMPVKEAEATNSLIDQGVDVITCHVDSPKVVVETAERRGMYVLRLPRQPGDACSKGLSDRRRMELGEGLHRLRQEFKAGKKIPEPGARRLEGRDRQDVALRAGRQRRSQEGGRRGEGASSWTGKFVIFKGPLKDNTGKEVIPAGKELRPDGDRTRRAWIIWSKVLGK